MEVFETLDLKVVAVTGVSVVLGYYVIAYVWESRKIRSRIRKKQSECSASIQELENKLNTEGPKSKRVQQRLLDLSFAELQSELQRGSLTPLEVLRTYQTKAMEENQRLNFMTEPVKEAEKIATSLRSSQRESKPLYGIPISIKENYLIQGYDSTGGMSLFLNKPAPVDGVLLEVLKAQGAVPFVRTNIPQSMMTFECSNPIFGTTVNPHNLKRGPGGSSGGEGAILAAEASILGWGSDIGGSLRIPSHFCGIYCLKPTFGRLSLRSCEDLIYGQTVICPTAGPMARDVHTLVEAMRAVLCPLHFQLDPKVPPIPFRNEIYERRDKLRIGYYTYDGTVKCIPGVERGMQEAKLALEKMGHTLVPFSVPRVEYMFGLFIECLFGDGGENFMEQMNDDEIDSSISLVIKTYKLPRFLQTMISYILTWISGENTPGLVLRGMQGSRSVKDWWKLVTRIEDYQVEFAAHWNAHKIDAVLAPTMPYVAVPTGAVKYLLGGVSYTGLYNLVNYPAGCVPVTKVTAEDQKRMKDYPAKTTTEKMIRKFYSSDTGGLPVAVQCVAPPYQEELTLRVMRDLETGLTRK